MHKVTLGAGLLLSSISSAASAQVDLWNFDVTVYASGSRTTHATNGPPYTVSEPFAGSFTFSRSFEPFTGTIDISKNYNSPIIDPFGLGWRFLMSGAITFEGGQITGKNLSYSSGTSHCYLGGISQCVSYELKADKFSLAFVSTSSPRVTPPVPELSAWAMMLVGFGAIGATMRRRRRASARPTQLVA